MCRMGVPPSVAGLIEDSLSKERSGDLAASLSCANKALALARLTGDAEEVPSALVAAARSRFRLGQYVKARELAEEALSLAVPETLPAAGAAPLAVA